MSEERRLTLYEIAVKLAEKLEVDGIVVLSIITTPDGLIDVVDAATGCPVSMAELYATMAQAHAAAAEANDGRPQYIN